MDQEQINIITMQSNTADYMAANQALWSGIKATGDAVGQLNANNQVIVQKRDEQETATVGMAENTRQARHELEEEMVAIADQLYALGAKNDDAVLEAQSHLTLSQLDGLDPEKLVQTAKDLSALATANLAALADYGITAADATALDTLSTAYNNLKGTLPAAMAKRAGQTKTLPQAIKDNQSLLRKQLDRQMTKFKKTSPEFYAGYQAARVIINRRSHHAGKSPAPAPPNPPAK